MMFRYNHVHYYDRYHNYGRVSDIIGYNSGYYKVIKIRGHYSRILIRVLILLTSSILINSDSDSKFLNLLL